MGSVASKPARKLARAPPAWAGARTPSTGEQAPASRYPTPRASEIKDESIEQDSKDPHFMANLSRLGQVRAVDRAQRLFQTRLQSEDEARSARPPHNHLVAGALIDLLEERKYVSTPKDLIQLANKYDIDHKKVENLARYVNSVSIHQDSVKRWVSDDGEERTTMIATWIDPKVQEERLQLGSGR
ncbi:hypothetical protein C8Q79DRAFT_1009047 [Trametes meyenii]|nr:hypothetical protein C8Q79DRAFT_1009047 [Trametes meyenii]